MGHYESDLPEFLELEKLVFELKKRNPDEKLIKETMGKLNIPYSTDPLKRLNVVLSALNDTEII